MSIYLKLFETTSQCNEYINGSDVILPNVSVAEGPPAVVYYNRWFAPSQRIRYTAPAKLNSAWSDETATFGSTIKSHTFKNGVGIIEFNSDVTRIGAYAFENCDSLTSITIPDSVTSINDDAFSYCTNLTSVTIPNGVTNIGSEAFYECSGLTNITIPDSVTNIDDYAFYGCSSLTSIDMPSSVTSIGSNAFQSCTSLTSITIPNSVTSIGSSVFSGCYFTSANFANNSSLDEITNNYWGATIVDEDINGLLIKNNGVVKYRGTSNSVTIPNTITSIGNGAFSDCTGLTSITIPDSVTSIDGSAFGSCSGLISITIPNSVTGIGNNAFRYCSNLTSVTIGSGVTSIGGGAFQNCTSLTSITSNATTAPTIQSSTFRNVKTYGTLTVPTGSTGYNVWMGTGNYYLGKYKWTKVEQ